MKSKNSKICILLLCLLVICAMTLTSCKKDEEDEGGDVITEGAQFALVEFESDSDNGYEWKYTQDSDVFKVEVGFTVDEGTGETQYFALYPKKTGSAKLVFEYEDADKNVTKYTYELEAKGENIKVVSSSGEVNGEEVEAPEMEIGV